MRANRCFWLFSLALAIELTGAVVAQPIGKDVVFGHLYCSTADPLGVVYMDVATGQEKRLFRDGVWRLLRGPRSWVAALRNGDQVEVFRDGKLVRLLKLRGTDNDLVGWTNEALVYQTPEGLRALDVAKGGSHPLEYLNGVVAVHPAEAHWWAVTRKDEHLCVQVFSSSGTEPIHVWRGEFPGRFWDSVAIGNRYLVMWAREFDNDGNYMRDRLWVFDLVERTQKQIPAIGRCAGLSPGRSGQEVLAAFREAGEPVQSSATRVDAINLPDVSHRTLVTIGVSDATLEALTADGRWLVMYVTYPDSGPGRPGKVFAVHLKDARRKVLREKVYECVASP